MKIIQHAHEKSNEATHTNKMAQVHCTPKDVYLMKLNGGKFEILGIKEFGNRILECFWIFEKIFCETYCMTGFDFVYFIFCCTRSNDPGSLYNRGCDMHVATTNIFQ